MELSLTMRNGCDWLKTDSDCHRDKCARWVLILLRGVVLLAEKCCNFAGGKVLWLAT